MIDDSGLDLELKRKIARQQYGLMRRKRDAEKTAKDIKGLNEKEGDLK